MTQLPALSPAERAVTVGRQRIAITCTAATAVCACVCAHACACMHDVLAIYDNNILPRLIMILIKIIILYFIQIRHTYDFHSTGTRLVSIIGHRLMFFLSFAFYSGEAGHWSLRCRAYDYFSCFSIVGIFSLQDTNQEFHFISICNDIFSA